MTPEIIFETYIIFVLVTAHICLFVDMSPLQKHPMCMLSYCLAALLSAVLPSLITLTYRFSSDTMKMAVGFIVAVICGVIITLFIERVLKFNRDTKAIQ